MSRDRMLEMTGWAQQVDRVAGTIARASEDVSQHPAEGGMLLFKADDGTTLLLNETAVAVWEACAHGTTLEELIGRIARRYDVDMDTAADHVEQLVALFAESGLLMLERGET